MDINQTEKHEQAQDDNNDAYSLYVYAIRSPVTRDTYLRRLRISLTIFKFYLWMSLWRSVQLICTKGYIKSKVGF